MADERIEDITGGAIATLADGDMFVALDASDTTDDAQGTAKNVLCSVIKTYVLTTGGMADFGSASSPAATPGLDHFHCDIDPTLTPTANNQELACLRLRNRGTDGIYTGVQRFLVLSENGGGGMHYFQLFEGTGQIRSGYTAVASPTYQLDVSGTGNFTGALRCDDLLLYDTDASDVLTIHWNEDDSAARTLNILVGGADQSIDFSKYIAKTGTPANNQAAVWTADGILEGEANWTYSAGIAKILTTGIAAYQTQTSSTTLYSGMQAANDNSKTLQALCWSSVAVGNRFGVAKADSGELSIGATQLLIGTSGLGSVIIGTNDTAVLTISSAQVATFSSATAIDAGDAVSFEIPNSATPTVNADGEIALDTTVTDFSHGVLKYFGGEEMGVVALPIAQFTTPTGGNVVAYNATTDEFELVAQAGGGDMSASTYDPASIAEQLVGLVATQTLTNKTLTSPVLTTPQINDTSADHQYIFAVSELVADRTVTLPLLTGNDTFVFNDFAATLNAKTIALGSNTVSGSIAEFNTACTDATFATSGGAFHDGFSDFVANEHIDHTAVTITVAATTNETTVAEGAQDISASRTFTVGIADNPIIPGTGGIEIPQGTTAQRVANEGVLRVNTTTGTTEIYRGAAWVNLEAGGGISDGDTLVTGLTFPNTGLHILDTNASHDLIIAPGSDITADRTLTLTTGDADRTVTLSGNLTVESASTVNQDLSSDATPTFAGANVSTGTATLGTVAGDINAGAASSLEIPNSATPTVTGAAGRIAVDTTVSGFDGLIKYYDGTTEMAVVAVPVADLTTTDNDVVAYSTGKSGFNMEAQAGGAGGDDTTITIRSTDADLSAAVDTHYHWDISGFTTHRTLTLPATAAVGERVGITIDVGDDTYELLIKNAASDTIDGTNHDTNEYTRLFITGETLVFRCVVANTDWIVETNNMKRCIAKMSLSADQTSFTDSAYTQVNFNATDDDVGDIADPTTLKGVKVRRAGRYLINFSARPATNLEASSWYATEIQINAEGTPGSLSSLLGIAATASTVYSAGGSGYVNLSNDDEIEMFARFDFVPSTYTVLANYNTYLEVIEQ